MVCTPNLAFHSHMALTSHSYKAGTEHAGRLAINHQARSAVICSASRMTGELHPAKMFRPESTDLSCIWMAAYNEFL